MAIYKTQRLYSGVIKEESFETTKVTGHPRITKVHKKTKLYGSVLGEKQFGIGKFLWKGVKTLLKPSNAIQHLGAIGLGGMLAGPVGAAVGAGLSGLNAWHKEGQTMGHSFDDWGQREFSKPIGGREVVDEETAERGRKDGVIQKKPNGSWGIISYKTTKPTWWPSSYSSREKALGALRGYEKHKHGK